MKIKLTKKEQQFLIECLGECWHKWVFDYDSSDFTLPGLVPEMGEYSLFFKCNKCKDFKEITQDAIDGKEPKIYPNRSDIDLTQWEGFGILKTWAQKQLFWQMFIEKYGCCFNSKWLLEDELIQPVPFAKAIYEFLHSNTIKRYIKEFLEIKKEEGNTKEVASWIIKINRLKG